MEGKGIMEKRTHTQELKPKSNIGALGAECETGATLSLVVVMTFLLVLTLSLIFIALFWDSLS